MHAPRRARLHVGRRAEDVVEPSHALGARARPDACWSRTRSSSPGQGIRSSAPVRGWRFVGGPGNSPSNGTVLACAQTTCERSRSTASPCARIASSNPARWFGTCARIGTSRPLASTFRAGRSAGGFPSTRSGICTMAHAPQSSSPAIPCHERARTRRRSISRIAGSDAEGVRRTRVVI